MFERMLDRQSRPDMAALAAWCGECEGLFLSLAGFIEDGLAATAEIRFPYGNSYGWCVTYRRKKKLLCDVFPEADAVNVMLRLTNDAFDAAFPTVSEYTQRCINAKYPCGSGGWIHYRITEQSNLDDIKRLLILK